MNNLIQNIKRPPFYFTYYNPFDSNSDYYDSWYSYIKDNSLAEYSASLVGNVIKETSSEQISTAHEIAYNICGKIDNISSELANLDNSIYTLNENIEHGFDRISKDLYDGFNNIMYGLQEIAMELSQVNQRLELIQHTQIVTNILLENIAELLTIPDSEMERQRNIKLGLQFFMNAELDEDLFEDALKEFLKAEKKMEQDYFVLYHIGMIKLYNEKNSNIKDAADYFTKAAKYASIESNPNATRIENVFKKTLNIRFTEQNVNESNQLKYFAAKAFMLAASARYILSEFEKAFELIEKAIALVPENNNLYFYAAKYGVRSNNIKKALKYLNIIFERDIRYIVLAVGDIDLLLNKEIQLLLLSINQKLVDEIKSLISKFVNHNISSVKNEVHKLENLLKNTNYIEKYEGLNETLKNIDRTIKTNDKIQKTKK